MKVNRIEHSKLLLDSVITAKIGGKEIQLLSESMFAFHKLLTFVERDNKEKLKKDIYYVYYMLRFCPKREQLADDIIALVKKRKEGKQVKENLE